MTEVSLVIRDLRHKADATARATAGHLLSHVKSPLVGPMMRG
jgi:hypothetical protein